MPIDYSQLLSSLIEETLENLADIDESLLTLELNNVEPEKTNRLFRSIHTIKGNSVLFKLENIGNLMHHVETFLEPVRSGIINLERSHIDLLLQVADTLRKTLSDIQLEKPINEESLQALASVFQDLSSGGKEKVSFIKQDEGVEHLSGGISKKWQIHIQPEKDIFRKNLEPVNAFRLLQEQGELVVRAIPDKLVSFDVFDPLECYLSWELELGTKLKKEQILEILSWVFEEKNIQITEATTEKAISIVSSKSSKVNQSAYHVPSTLRISAQKIDALMNLIGELVIIKSILHQALEKAELKQTDVFIEPLDLLERNTRSLQESVLRIRMVPIAFAVNRFPRMVFDIANKLRKLVDFSITGDQTEIDKSMIEKISDPLLHLIRNAIDHGIESPEARERLGKNKKGLLQLIASQEGESILIEIKDDGAGIDPEKIRKAAISKGLINKKEDLPVDELYKLLFKPGFSMADHITEYSGRGVGLDVVEKNIKSLGGTIQLNSLVDKGTSFKIKLPLTLAIMECQLIKAAKQVYMIPLSKIIAMEKRDPNNVIQENGKQYYCFNQKNVQLVYLEEIFKNNVRNCINQEITQKGCVVIVETNEQYFALVCDELLLQQPVVMKSLEDNYCKVPGLAGGTIMGNGEVGLILDIQGILDIALQSTDKVQKMTKTDFFFANQDLKSSQNEVTDVTATESLEIICFNLGKTEYAINMRLVREVKPTTVPTVLPFSPPYLVGVINLQGRIVPALDLRQFFNIDETSAHERILIVVGLEEQGVEKLLGLIVDGINDTRTISNKEISSVPKTGYLALKDYIQGFVYINKRIVTLLKIHNILNVTRLRGNGC